jgi:catechol 2,3-dioxygenase-like lactoylglutathione lyase family enzyme
MKAPKLPIPSAMTLLLVLCYAAAGAMAAEPDAASHADNPSTRDYLGAVGIGVSDLKVSTEFYQQILGLELQRTYELGHINENILGYPGSDGTVLVLMNWPNDTERRYDGSDVKNVFYVDDPAAVIDRIRALGGAVDREATPHAAVNGTLVGLGRDPDNYVVEVLQRQ